MYGRDELRKVDLPTLADATREGLSAYLEGMKRRLDAIRKEVWDPNNPGHNPCNLPRRQQELFAVAMNTFDYIIRDKEDIIRRLTPPLDNRLFDYVPARGEEEDLKLKKAFIHLGQVAYAVQKGASPALGYLNYVFATMGLFINSYIDIKNLKEEDIKNITKREGTPNEILIEFLDKMVGICIDARTDAAFNYAKKFAKDAAPEPFDAMIAKCADIERKEEENKPVYFRAFKRLLDQHWGDQFTKDEKEEYVVEGGRFSDKYLLEIKQYLDKIGLEPQADFLELIAAIPDKHRAAYCKFVLLHDDLIQDISTQVEESRDLTKIESFYRFMFMALIHQGNFDPKQDGEHKQEEAPKSNWEKLEAYIDKIPLEKIIEIWSASKIRLPAMRALKPSEQARFVMKIAAKALQRGIMFAQFFDLTREEGLENLKHMLAMDNIEVMQFILSSVHIPNELNINHILLELNAYKNYTSRVIGTNPDEVTETLQNYLLINDVTNAVALLSSVQDKDVMMDLLYTVAFEDRNICNQFIARLIEELISTNENPFVIIRLLDMFEQNSPGALQRLIPTADNVGKNNNFLHLVAQHNSPLLVEYLSEKGVPLTDKNSDGRTPMMEAVVAQSTDSIHLFPDEEKVDETDGNQYGAAMVRAAKHNQQDAAKAIVTKNPLLTKALAAPCRILGLNLPNDHVQSLHFAIMHNDIPLAEQIYARTKDINARANHSHGRTPLHVIATSVGVTKETLEWVLKQNGIDLLALYDGKTAFQLGKTREPIKSLLDKPIPIIEIIEDYLSEEYLSRNDVKTAAKILVDMLGNVGKVAIVFKELQVKKNQKIAELAKEFLIAGKEKIGQNKHIPLIDILQKTIPNIAQFDVGNGETLLFHAQDEEFAQALLAKGAKVTQLNKQGESALLSAVKSKIWDVIGVLAKQIKSENEKKAEAKETLEEMKATAAIEQEMKTAFVIAAKDKAREELALQLFNKEVAAKYKDPVTRETLLQTAVANENLKLAAEISTATKENRKIVASPFKDDPSQQISSIGALINEEKYEAAAELTACFSEVNKGIVSAILRIDLMDEPYKTIFYRKLVRELIGDKENQIMIIEIITEYPAICKIEMDEQKNTLLHLAAQHDLSDLTEALIISGNVEPLKLNKQNETADKIAKGQTVQVFASFFGQGNKAPGGRIPAANRMQAKR